MENRILLVGGGGNCKSIIDVLLENGEFTDIGIVDNKPNTIPIDNKKVVYLGQDSDLQNLFDSGWRSAFISIGSVGDTSIREKIYSNLKNIGFSFPNIISNKSIVSNNCILGYGVFVGKGAIINVGSKIGNCCIINTGSVVEHDCCIGDLVHISPGAVLCGGVSVGSNSHIGAGSTIKQYVSIGNNTIIGMGSVVVGDIGSNCVCYGNPCRFIKKR